MKSPDSRPGFCLALTNRLAAPRLAVIGCVRYRGSRPGLRRPSRRSAAGRHRRDRASDDPRAVRSRRCATHALYDPRAARSTRCTVHALCRPRAVRSRRCAHPRVVRPRVIRSRVVRPTRCAGHALLGPRVSDTRFCAQHHRKRLDSGLRSLCGNEKAAKQRLRS